MQPYLTPDRFRTLGLGVDLTDVPTIEIRAAIARATTTIEAYCNVPLLPQKHSFRGGTVTLEEHQWVIDQYERPRPHQFWPWHQPVIDISFFAIYATSAISVGIDPSNLFINNSAGYVEISSLNLTQFGIFGAGIVPLLGLYDPVAKMSYTYGRRFEVTDDPLDATSTSYKIYQGLNQFWTSDTVVVKKNGTPVTPDVIDRVEGRVEFVSALTANDVLTASYTYVLGPGIAEACALLVARDIDEAQLRSKGLGNLAAIRIQEVELRRSVPRSNVTERKILVPDEVAVLLEPYAFVTAR